MSREKLKKSGIARAALPALLGILLIVLLFAIICAISIGAVDVPLADTFQIVVHQLSGGRLYDLDTVGASYISIVWLIRFPRVLTSCLIGMGLAVCGLVMQASVQNPLADPYILGISSGATLGATLALAAGVGSIPALGDMSVAFCAFVGALLASALVLTLSGIGGRITSTKLVLSGTAINSMLSAFSSMVIYFANNEQALKNVTFWTMGSVASANWSKLPFLAAVVLLGVVFYYTQHRTMDVMLMGDEGAATLGVNLSRCRMAYLAVASLLTGIMVANCGMIGFVGLIVPHIARALFGSGHKTLLPITVMFGGIFMVATDLLARTIVNNMEIPVGVITAAVGAPVFIYMLVKKNYGFGG